MLALISSMSRRLMASRTFSLRYSRMTASIKAERDALEPALRSISSSKTDESVIDVFSFILPLYYSFSAYNLLPRHRDGADYVGEDAVGVEAFQLRFGLEHHAMAQQGLDGALYVVGQQVV